MRSLRMIIGPEGGDAGDERGGGEWTREVMNDGVRWNLSYGLAA